MRASPAQALADDEAGDRGGVGGDVSIKALRWGAPRHSHGHVRPEAISVGAASLCRREHGLVGGGSAGALEVLREGDGVRVVRERRMEAAGVGGGVSRIVNVGVEIIRLLMQRIAENRSGFDK